MHRFKWLLLPVLVAPFILLAPVYLRGQALFWGTPLLQFIPWWDYAREMLLAGRLPLWNPALGMGAPLLANYQSALFYPPTWLYFLFGGFGGATGMAWWQALSVALHLAWSGLGMAMLARQLGLGGLAQAVAGLSFGLSGYLVARAGFLSINAAAAWLPWVLLSLTMLLDAAEKKAQRRAFIFLAICLALQLLSGHAQTTWYTWLLAGLWAAMRWIGLWRAGQGRRVRDSALLFALAIVLALGLAAIQLFPTAEYLSQSQRSTAVEFSYALNYSFWPWHLLTFLVPGFFGSPASGDYWGFGNYWEDAVYIGVLPLLLAGGAIWASLRRKPVSVAVSPGLQPGFTWFLCLVFGVSILLALGSFTALYPWLYHHIPTFSMFQAPARWTLWAVCALSLLAGIGAERWRRPEKRPLYWTRLGAAGAFSIMMGAGLGWFLAGEISPTFLRATALLGFWCLGAGLLSLLAPVATPPREQPGPASTSRARSSWWPVAVLLWIGLDLLAAGWGLNPGGPLSLYGPSPTTDTVRALAQGGRLYLPASDEYQLKYVRFLRFDTFDPGEDWGALRAAQMPNTNLLDGLAATNNFDPLTPGRFSGWLEMLAEASPEVHSQLLELMDVGVIESLQPGQPYGVGFSQVPHGERLRFAPCQWLVSGEQAARRMMLSGQIDFDTQVVIEASEPENKQGLSCAGPPGPALETDPAPALVNPGGDPHRLVIDLQAPAAGWLVLSDVWYPGWRAWVDGRPAAILRANYLFRAVKVEPGDRQVIFAYQPLSFRLGVGVSLLSFLALIGLVAWNRRARDLTIHPPG